LQEFTATREALIGQLVSIQRRDRDWNVLDRLLAPLRGDDDFFGLIGALARSVVLLALAAPLPAIARHAPPKRTLVNVDLRLIDFLPAYLPATPLWGAARQLRPACSFSKHRYAMPG
jgi:hypothetical protein